jgi:beta-glucanase (GH16 family)
MYRRIEKSEVLQAGQWVYDHPFFLILNVAVGGSFTGPPNASTPFPQKMTIDYVRVYK